MTSALTTRVMRRKGYALVVTLVMLALLSVIIGQLAQQSADRSIQANHAEDALRQYWAGLTCRQTLLANAPKRFDARDAAWLASLEEDADPNNALTHKPAVVETLQLDLLGLRVWLRIEDEQTKINLNAQLRTDLDAAVAPDRVIAKQLPAGHHATLQLTRPAFVQALGLQPLESWAQVLPGQSPLDLLGIRQPDQLLAEPIPDAVTRQLTLWGSGHLNLYRVEDNVLRQQLAGQVRAGTIDRILQLRREQPGLGLRALINNATAEHAEDQPALQAALTDRSACYAMWMASRNSRRPDAATTWSLSILEPYTNTPNGEHAHLRHVHW